MRIVLGALLLLAALTAAGGTSGAQEATPAPVCLAGPATSVAEFRTVNQEIATDLDRLFACLTVRDWSGVESFVSIPEWRANPFASLRALDQTGLFTITTGLVSQAVRSTGPEGAKVEMAWSLGGQLRFERWTFQKSDGRWRITLVEPGIPVFEGSIVGITGRVAPEGVNLGRAELINPGGIELGLEVASTVVSGENLLVVFPHDACDRAEASALTAVLELEQTAVTLSLDTVGDGLYALALVPSGRPISRESICAAPTAVVKISS